LPIATHRRRLCAQSPALSRHSGLGVLAAWAVRRQPASAVGDYRDAAHVAQESMSS
jgi:hypothetical protein